jgi:hypothetical protein
MQSMHQSGVLTRARHVLVIFSADAHVFLGHSLLQALDCGLHFFFPTGLLLLLL